MNPSNNSIMFHNTRTKQTIIDDFQPELKEHCVPKQINNQQHNQWDFSQELPLLQQFVQNKKKNYLDNMKQPSNPSNRFQIQKPLKRKLKQKGLGYKRNNQSLNLDSTKNFFVEKNDKDKLKKQGKQILNGHRNNKSSNIQKPHFNKSSINEHNHKHSFSYLIPSYKNMQKNSYFTDDFFVLQKNNKPQLVKRRTKSHLQNVNMSKKLKEKTNIKQNNSKNKTKLQQNSSLSTILLQKLIQKVKINDSLYTYDKVQQSSSKTNKCNKSDIIMTECSEQLIRDMKQIKNKLTNNNQYDQFIKNDKIYDSQQRCTTEDLIKTYITIINQNNELNQDLSRQQNNLQKQVEISDNQVNFSQNQLNYNQQSANQQLKQQLNNWHKMLTYFKQNITKNGNNEVAAYFRNFINSADQSIKQILCKRYQDQQMPQFNQQRRVQINFSKQSGYQQEKCIDNRPNQQFIQNSTMKNYQYQYTNKQKSINNYPSHDQQISQRNVAKLQKTYQNQESSQFSSVQQLSVTNTTNDLMRISSIDKLLKNQIQQLQNKKNRDLNKLESQFIEQKISQSKHSDFQTEKNKILKWYEVKFKHLNKTRKNIWRGYKQINHIINKGSIDSMKAKDRKSKIFKCLSDQYLLKKKADLYSFDQNSNQAKLISQVRFIQSNQSDDYSETIDQIKSNFQQIKRTTNLHTPEHQKKTESVIYQQINNNFTDQSQNSQKQQKTPSQQQIKQKNSLTFEDAIEQLSLDDVSVNQDANYQTEKKPAYLTFEEKEDIFQFIFLDLCIELMQYKSTNNIIMNTIWKFISKEKEIKSRKKGVKTSLAFVKEYLKKFQNYVLRANQSCIMSVNIPIGPSAQQMLRYLREDDYSQDQEQILAAVVIPIQTFDRFQASLLASIQIQRIYQDDDKEEKRKQFLKNVLHVHNKAIFDSLNEYLDLQRPFKLMGTPFPWKKTPEAVRQITMEKAKEKFQRACQNVIDACSYICGILYDKEDSLLGMKKNVSQQYVETLRQDRLSRLLASQLIQNEVRWLFLDDEQAEVMMDVCKYVYRRLLEEVIFELIKIEI